MRESNLPPGVTDRMIEEQAGGMRENWRTVTYEDYHSDGFGICISCGAIQCGGCEPDAREYSCKECGENKVYGMSEALIMGEIDVEPQESDEDLE